MDDQSLTIEIFAQLPEDLTPGMEEMVIRVSFSLSELPELFTCSMLFEKEEWESMEKFDRIASGRYLSRIASLPNAPFSHNGFTSSRHNRYTKR
jgi:hypothetical protein